MTRCAQAVRRQVLAHCTLQLEQLDGKPVSDSESQLVALTHGGRPRSSGAGAPRGRSAAPSARKAADAVAKGPRGSGRRGDRPPRASHELISGKHLVIQGDALDALSVRLPSPACVASYNEEI